MITQGARSELTSWLAEVSKDSGVDLNGHVDALADQGLSKSVMYDVSEDEWAEVNIPLGHRIIIRIAASEIYLKAEKANLADQVERIRKARDALVAQSASDRSELERIQADLQNRESDVSQAHSRHTEGKAALQQKQSALSQVESAVSSSKAEIAQLMADIESANKEKQEALKLKEEAIMRAVQFGVQGQRAPAASPAAQPSPAFGNGFGGGSQPPAAQPYQPPAAQPYQPPAAQPYQPPAAQPYLPPAAQPYQPPAAARPRELSLEEQPWYFGTISREECEAKLAAGQDGDYMIRKSSRGQNSYSLSVRASGGAPKHFKVEKTGAGAWKLAQKNSDGMTFPGIPELVMHYQVNTASGVRMVRPTPGGPGAAAQGGGGGGSFLPGGGAPAGARYCWDGGCTGMPMAPDDRFCGGCGKQVHEIQKWNP